MSFGVDVNEMVPFAGSIVSLALVSTMPLIVFSTFFHNSTSTELVNEIDDVPPSPLAEPPMLTDKFGLVGRLYRTKVLVTYL